MIRAESQISWQDYLAIIVRRRWFFAVPCALIVAITLIVSLFLPKIYRAETVILVQEESIMNPLIQGLAVATPVQDRLRSLREEILGWTSLTRLAHDLTLDQRAKTPVAFENLIRKLQEDIEVKMVGRDLVRIYYENEDPKLAQQLVNTICAIFLERNMTAQSSESETAISFINSEMGVYQKKLEASERSLREFKEIFVTQMPVAVELNDQIIELEVQLSRLLAENTEAHPAVLETRRRIVDFKARRNEELKRFIASAISRGQDPASYTDLMSVLGSPDVEAPGVDPEQLRMAREAYSAWVDRLDNSKMSKDAVGTTQIQVINTDPNAAGGASPTSAGILSPGPVSISLAPWQEQALARLTRDYEVNAQTYQSLQQRLEQAKITQRLGASDEGLKFKILEPARLPLKPVRPNLLQMGIFAVFLGMFVGAGAAFVAEYLDQSFQTADELQHALEIPVLGTISTILTEDDVVKRRKELRTWLSIGGWRVRLANALKPVSRGFDQLLLKWGL